VEEFICQVSGNAPFRFTGEVVVSSQGDRVAGREQTRWHDITVYKTVGNNWVVEIGYVSRFQGEVGHQQCDVVATPQEIVNVLVSYKADQYVKGFPGDKTYAERQGRLLADVWNRYQAQVTEILCEMPECAREVE
jgi:hypothetical protein